MRAPCLVSLIALVVLAPDAGAETFTLQPIVLTGDPVPGVPGAHFTWIGGAPIGPDDPPPLIDAAGNVSFGAGWLSQVTPHGLFIWRRGTLEPLVLTGDSAVGTGSTFAALPGAFPGAPRMSGTSTSFDGAFDPPGETTFEHGIWADRGGARELIVRESDQPPGAPPGAQFFQWFHTLAGGGRVIVNARYSVGSTSQINDHGFWRDDDGTLYVVALARTQAPGVPPGVLFGNGTELALGAFQDWDLDAQGRITLQAMLMESGVTDLDDEGIWTEGAGDLQLLVREGDFAPGMGHPNAHMLGNFGFRTFGHDDVAPLVRNGQGHVAFGARVEVPGFNNRANVLYVDRGAGPERVTFGMPSGSNRQGEAAPGFPEGTAFKRFRGGIRINAAGEVTFSATVGTAAGTILDETTALFVERGGSIKLVARTGQQAAGQAPGVTYNFPFPVLYLASGQVVFASAFSNGGRGLFVADPDGSVAPVLSNGSVVQVGPGDARIVSKFSLASMASDQREMAISVNFQDSTDAIVIAAPQPVVAVESSGSRPTGLMIVGTNPFVRETALAFELSGPAPVRLAVHDLSGREIAVLLEGTRGAGRHVVRWDGSDRNGRSAAAGMYFARLERGGESFQAKVVKVE